MGKFIKLKGAYKMIHKTGKQIILTYIIILAFMSIFLNGCQKEVIIGENETTPWKEERMNLPEGSLKILDICALEDGNLRLATVRNDMKNLEVWDSKDHGVTWEVKTDIKDKLDLSGEEFGWIFLSADGTIFCRIFDKIEDLNDIYYSSSQYFIIQSDGIVNELQIHLNEIDENTIDKHDDKENDMINGVLLCEFAPDSKLLVSDYAGTAYLIDQSSGDILTTYSLQKDGMAMVSDLEIYNNMLVAVSSAGTLFYDFQTGVLINGSPMELATSQAMEDMKKSLIASSAQVQKSLDGKSFYYCNSAGVYQYIEDGSFDQVLSSKDISMSIANLYMHSMTIMNDGEIYLAMVEGSSNQDRLYRYTKSSGESKKDVLTIWAMQESFDLQNVVSMYREANPNVQINIELGMTGTDAVTVSDVISNLNTKLLSGNGPDVILLDQMPIQSYIDKGMLADLSDLISEADVFENIVNRYKKDDGLYAIPSRFAPMVIVGDKEALELSGNPSELIDYAEKLKAENTDVPIFAEQDFEQLNNFIYYLYASSWMEERNVNESELIKYLTQIDRIYKLCVNPYNVSFSIKQHSPLMSVNYYMLADNKLRISTEFLVDPSYQLTGIYAVNNLLPSTGYAPIGNENQKSYIAYSIYGVNSQSKSLELAKEFAAFAISEQVMSVNNGIGNPVHRKAFTNTMNQSIETDMEFSLGVLHLKALSEDAKQEFAALVESLDTPVLDDGVVKEVVFEQLEEYIFGRISVEEAAANIIKKLSLYLVE